MRKGCCVARLGFSSAPNRQVLPSCPTPAAPASLHPSFASLSLSHAPLPRALRARAASATRLMRCRHGARRTRPRRASRRPHAPATSTCGRRGGGGARGRRYPGRWRRRAHALRCGVGRRGMAGLRAALDRPHAQGVLHKPRRGPQGRQGARARCAWQQGRSKGRPRSIRGICVYLGLALFPACRVCVAAFDSCQQ